MIEQLRTGLYLRESHYDLDVPIQIEIEYQLGGGTSHPFFPGKSAIIDPF
jgi:hypothetical protein